MKSDGNIPTGKQGGHRGIVICIIQLEIQVYSYNNVML